ncbi:ATPase, AAA family [Dictyocaulus viviparus]|uniref:ATPase, AAA family n=1 Tax=Dictyocaulus viviparus TaxID=29172 RepID=A0A0D8Y6C7_DICVI|nr:ATPase, AAA family [Dictyocaulus viviparus]
MCALMQSLESPVDYPPADPDVCIVTSQKKTVIQNFRPKNIVKKGHVTNDSESVLTKKQIAKATNQTISSSKKAKQSLISQSTEMTDALPDTTEEKQTDEFVPRGYCPDLVEAIEQTMSRNGTEVTWADIAGLDGPKELFKQTIVLPALMPSFFKVGYPSTMEGSVYGRTTRTGKTLLAKAVATECHTTFFAVNCGDLASKWRGDSEKMIKLLFEMARHYAPSTIFIDEIDTIGSQRGHANEHEASRRVKAQLLVEMDGFCKEDEGKRVLVLAATNFPWLLDEALRRRFEQRIYIPLPDKQARLSLLQSSLKEVRLEDNVDLETFAERLEGFSGADITNVCRKAALMGVKRQFYCSISLPRLTRTLTPAEIAQLTPEDVDLPVTWQDLQEAHSDTNPSVSEVILLSTFL